MIGVGLAAGMEAISVEHVQVVALYDLESGRIVHLHTVTTLTGGTPPTQEAAVAEAKMRAARRHGDVDRLGVALSNDPEHCRPAHRIDPTTKAFHPLPPEARET